MDVWVERELDGGALPDQRLKARLGKLLSDLGQRIGGTIPAACQDWAASKAAYRFFSRWSGKSHPSSSPSTQTSMPVPPDGSHPRASRGPSSQRVAGRPVIGR